MLIYPDDISNTLAEHDRIIYVLELENNNYYVGQTTTKDRFKQQSKSKGAEWTKLHPPIKIVKIIPIDLKEYSHAEIIENRVTIEYMNKYGFNNVRGGFWCNTSINHHIESLIPHIHSLEKCNANFLDNLSDFAGSDKFIEENNNMKTVTIYATGSWNVETKVSTYFISLEYQGVKKYITNNVSDSTVNRGILSGLNDALLLLKEPCLIHIITSTSLGVNKWKKSRKGVNADLISNIFSTALEKGSALKFDTKEGQGELVSKNAKE